MFSGLCIFLYSFALVSHTVVQGDHILGLLSQRHARLYQRAFKRKRNLEILPLILFK